MRTWFTLTVDGSSWCPAGAPQPVASLTTSYTKPASVLARSHWLSERGFWACPLPQMCQSLRETNMYTFWLSHFFLVNRKIDNILRSTTETLHISALFFNLCHAASVWLGHSVWRSVCRLVGVCAVCVHAFECDKPQPNPGLIKITAAVITEWFSPATFLSAWQEPDLCKRMCTCVSISMHVYNQDYLDVHGVL